MHVASPWLCPVTALGSLPSAGLTTGGLDGDRTVWVRGAHRTRLPT